MLVSCILPITEFNMYSEIAIDSILKQNMQNYELILLCNNMSNSDFHEIKARYGRDEKIRIFELKLPGLAFALNVGINYSKGEFIARMDADDYSFPSRFDSQSRFLRENVDVDVVGCYVELINEQGKVYDNFPFIQEDKLIKKLLPIRNSLVHPALMFRKAALIKVGGYKFGLMSEDHELFLRMAREINCKFYNLPYTLFQYRRHPTQITSSANKWKHFSEITSFLGMYFLKSGNPLFLLGIVWVFPPVCWLKDVYKMLRKKDMKY